MPRSPPRAAPPPRVPPPRLWSSLPASPGSEPRSPPAASPESSASASADGPPVLSSSCGRSPARPDSLSPLSVLAPDSRPRLPPPSDSRTSLSFRRSAKFGLVSPLSAHHGFTVSACQRSRVGHRSCGAPDSNPLIAPASVPSLAPFFGSLALRSSRVTGLLRYYGLC